MTMLKVKSILLPLTCLGLVVGFFKESWGWGGVFTFLGLSVLIASIIMIPKWNALPISSKTSRLA